MAGLPWFDQLHIFFTFYDLAVHMRTQNGHHKHQRSINGNICAPVTSECILRELQPEWQAENVWCFYRFIKRRRYRMKKDKESLVADIYGI